jgi:hypothetical protein
MAAFNPTKKPSRGFPSLAKDVASLKFSKDRPGHLASDLQRPDTSAIPDNRDADQQYMEGDVEPDFVSGKGEAFCTLQRCSQAAGCDWGSAQMAIRSGLKPDATAAGHHLFRAGSSTRKAVATLKTLAANSAK